MGAEMLFYPTAIGWATAQDEATNKEQYNAWQTIQRSHAIANGVPVISVNRVGLEQNGLMKFWGGSFVSNPFGTLLYEATHDQEEVAVIDIDKEKLDSYRTHWPFLRDRRIDSYDPIKKRYIDDDANIK
jgi:N-carbamoylputrescine amidase